MNKRILAAFMVSIFIVAAALVAAPATAHTTLGRPTDTPPYRTFDNDINPQHAFGPTGYVWPGGGKDWWLVGSSNYGVSMEPPGYQSPWGWYPQNALPSWYQLQGNTYAPFGAILTSTEDYDNMGDLIFAINFTSLNPVGAGPEGFDYNYTDVFIYIPPEFGMLDEAAISTSINVPYGGNAIAVVKADVKDPFGPNWWIVKVPGPINFLEANNWEEWYYIRINGVAAPKIAGKYFFKIFLNQCIIRFSHGFHQLFPQGGRLVGIITGKLSQGFFIGQIHD